MFSHALVLASAFLLICQATNIGTCSKTTVRREWRSLPEEDRASWIASVKCLASVHHHRLSYTAEGNILTGAPSLYDDFAYAHAAMEDTAHINPYFLPWHRWFLYIFDTALRQTCGYSGPTPYWDWSLDASDLVASPIFDPDPSHGLGGGGDCYSTATSDCLVQNGALSPLHPTPLMLSYPIPHTLRRNISLYTGELGPNEQPQNATLSSANIFHVTQSTTPGDFFMFQHAMTQMHNHVHNFVGGDLAGTCPKAVPEEECTKSFTPNDPLFWLHHAQLDRLWSNWQLLHSDNFQSFAGFPLHAQHSNWDDYTVNASIVHEMQFDRLSVPVQVSRVSVHPWPVFNHSEPPFCYSYSDETWSA